MAGDEILLIPLLNDYIRTGISPKGKTSSHHVRTIMEMVLPKENERLSTAHLSNQNNPRSSISKENKRMKRLI